MTVDEMVTDFRDMMQEYVEAFYSETDARRYLRKGLYHFTKRSKALLHRENFTIYPERIGDNVLPEIIDVTFVGDETSALRSLINSHFILYDGYNVAHCFYFDVPTVVAPISRPVPTGFTNIYPITVAEEDIGSVVATAALTVINGATDQNGALAFNATQNSDVLNITNTTNGWISNTSFNVNVLGLGNVPMTIAVVQAGVNDGYELTYRYKLSRGITLKDPASNNSTTRDQFIDLHRLAWQDWYAMTNDSRERNGVCYIDIIQNKLYISPTYRAGEISIEYHFLPSDDNWMDIINNLLLEEEYHDAVVDYALYLALKKDREPQLANTHLSSYLDNEKRAIQAVDEKLQKPHLDDFSDADMRYHRPRSEDSRQYLFEE